MNGDGEHLGGRRFNAIGYQMRQLEQRVRRLEDRLAATNNRRESRSEEEKSNERGSRS